MSRVKINFPELKPLYTAIIPVRIGDINYGGHAGNDAILSMVHEARVQLLQYGGFTEMNVGGCGVIMADVAIAYKREVFYGDVLHVDMFADELGNTSFGLLYRLYTVRDGVAADVAHARTGMVCFNYEARKKAAIPATLRSFLESNNTL